MTIAALLASLGAFCLSAPPAKVKALKEKATLRGHRFTVFAVAFSPNGKDLASAGRDGTVRLWDVRTGKNTATFTLGTEVIHAVAFSPDGKLLASGDEKDIRLWDVASGKNIATLKGATYTTSLAFGPGGDTLASGSDDDTARVWDLKTQKVRSALKVGRLHRQNSVAYSRAGKLLVADSGVTNVNLWDTATGKKSFTLKIGTDTGALGFSPDGKFLASGGGSERTVQVWDVATGKSTATFPVSDQITCLTFSPDGRFLAYAHRSPGSPSNGCIRLVDLTTRREVAAFEGKDSVMFMLAFSPTEGILASCDIKGVIKLWDVPAPAKAPR